MSLTRYKLIAIALSSFLTAAGGTLYAQKELYIDPGSVLPTSLSIKISLVAILGGVGTLMGPVVGAILLTAIEEGSRTLFGGTGRGTDLIIYGLLIVGFAVFKPEGILGLVAGRRGGPPAPKPGPAAPPPTGSPPMPRSPIAYRRSGDVVTGANPTSWNPRSCLRWR